MKKESTASRLKQLMSERGLRQVDILERTRAICDRYDVKMNKSDISQYVAGKVEPNQDKLFALALALNVSEGWLMGFDVPKERVTVLPKILPSAHAKTPALALDEQCLVDIYRELNQDGKTALVEYAELISSSDKYKKALSSEPDCG